MLKKSIVIILLMGCVLPSIAQLDPYKYRVGMGVGYANYYGDLSPYRIYEIENLFRHFDYNPNYIPEASYTFSLERRLSRSLSLMLSAGQYHMAMSDRYMDKENRLQNQLPNFDRSLNFQTKLQDAGMSIVFRTDNDRILNKTSFMAPYFTLGAGVFQFDVAGDLLDDAGLPYDYSNEFVMPNRQFETDLRALNTELEEGYSNRGFYYGLGLGIRFKIAKQVELYVQSDFRRSSSDYLDDVSGVYRESYMDEFQAYAARPGSDESSPSSRWRGDENGRNDWYMYHHAGIKISFATSKESFRASRVSPGKTYARSQAIAEMEKESLIREKDSIAAIPAIPAPSVQYFNFFQINPPQRVDEDLSWRVYKAEENIDMLADRREEELIEREMEKIYNEMDSVNILASGLANLEETTDQDMEDIDSLNQYGASLSGKLDSLTFRRNLLNNRIMLRTNRLDSLNQIKIKESEDARFDTLLFNQNFREFYNQLNGTLTQDGNWRQLSQTLDQSGSPGREQVLQDQVTDQGNFAYSYPPSQRFYSDEAIQSQTYRPYSYIPPEDREGNFYSQADPSTRGRNISPSREYIRSRSKTIYQPEPQRSVNYRQDQRSNTLVPVFIPRGGESNELRRAQNFTNDSLLVQSNNTDNGLINSNSTDSSNQALANNSIWRTKVDTLFLDKETIIGLPNSKKEVYFGVNLERLEEEEKQKLKEIAAILESQPTFYITLTGFADNTGDISYNLQLVEKRVNHVKSLLVNEYELEADRISVRPGGLLIRNRNRGSRNEDRKVEIIIYDPAIIK